MILRELNRPLFKNNLFNDLLIRILNKILFFISQFLSSTDIDTLSKMHMKSGKKRINDKN